MAASTFAAEQQRLVIYPDTDLPQARKAFARFQEAIKAERLDERYGVRAEFVPVDVTNPQAIESALNAAIERRPAAIIGTSGAISGVAKRLTQTIPILFASHPDVVQTGLVQSYAKPGGNLTGFTFHLPVDDKRLQILKEAVPGIRRVAVLGDRFWAKEEFAKTLASTGYVRHGLQFKMVIVEEPKELLAELARKDIRELDAWYVPRTFFTARHGNEIVKLLEQTRKPVMFSRTRMAEHGGLLSYQHDVKEPFAIWAGMLSMIFSGVPPSDIPVERPKDFELAVNVTTAKAMGLTLPKSLLRRADITY